MNMDIRKQTLIRRVAGDVVRILSATGLAMVTALVAAPLITRLFNPEAFGHFAVFTAVLAILLPLASLRYEWAMPMPSEELRAVGLFALCVVLVVGSSLAVAVLSALLGPILAERMNTSRGEIMLLPLAFFIMGLHAVMMSWLVRDHAFARVGLTRFSTIVGTVACQIALGQIHIGASGLILGLIGGNLIGVIIAASHCGRTLSKSTAGMSPSSMRRAAVEYRAFAMLTAPSGIINVIGFEIPSLILPSLYGLTIAGQYSLARRVVTQPAAFVGAAVSQVIWGNAAQLFNEEPARLWRLFLSLNVLLLGVMVPGLVLTWFGAEIFGFLFGSAWNQAGSIAGIGIVGEVLGLAASSTSSLANYRLNHWLSAWEIFRLTLVAGALFAAWQMALSPIMCIVGITAALAISHAVLFGLNAVAIMRAKSRAERQDHDAAAAIMP